MICFFHVKKEKTAGAKTRTKEKAIFFLHLEAETKGGGNWGDNHQSAEVRECFSYESS